MTDRRAAAIAENRFGLGARAGTPPPSDPHGWLKVQLGRFEPRPAPIAATGDSATMVKAFADYRTRVRTLKRQGVDKAATEADRSFLQAAYLAQARARIRQAVASDTPFPERLVAFWANHFAVSVEKQAVRGLGGLMEFEAIRPNLGGRFIDLWLAVMRHPAMLLYLDQAQSIGPDSPAARRAGGRGRAAGLNENLAREALELHSLGVRTGYSQADVTELARALTGWTIDSGTGGYRFAAAMHQPGGRTVLGRRYPDDGEEQARAILTDLAGRPETATHVAAKLVRHFIADTPPPAAVARVAAVFRRTGGSLPALHAALVDSPEAWSAGRAKFKTPWDWTVSALRAVAVPRLHDRMVGMLAELGQPPWRPRAPAGWADEATAWAGPDALLRRLEVADRIGRLAAPTTDARRLADRLLGGVSARTAGVIDAAASPGQGLTLLLVSPEFQRR